MAYTYTQLQNAVKHALGGNPSAASITPAVIVNNAIGVFQTLSRWSFLETNTTIDYTANQNYVDLPANFREMSAISDSRGNAVEATTPQEILSLRTTVNFPPSGRIWYAITWPAQGSVSSAPTPQLMLYPTPAESVTGGILLAYYRRIPALSNGSDVPDIPDQFQTLLMYLCRALAVSDEEQQQGADWATLNQILPKFIEQDAYAQRNTGQLRSQLRRRPRRWFTGNYNIVSP